MSDPSSPIAEAPPSPKASMKMGNAVPDLIFWMGVAAVVLAVCILCFYCLKHIFSFMGAKAYIVRMTGLHENQPIRAGETISIKLMFFKIQDDRHEAPVTHAALTLINSYLVLDFGQEVAVLRTFTSTKDAIIIRFSLRSAGNYSLSCYYWFYNLVGSPLGFEVLPGPISIRKTELQLQNPESIPVVIDQWVAIPMKVHDRYGNPSQIEESLVARFGIIVKMNDEYSESPDLNWQFALQGGEPFLQIKTKKARIFKCIMTFMGEPIEQGDHSSVFVVISMNVAEDYKFRTGFDAYFSLGSTPATLLFLGAERQDPSEIFVTVNQKTVSISAAMLAGIVFYPFLAFFINRRTKISIVGSHTSTNDANDANVSLKLSDGIQESVTFAVSSGAARILLATFGHVKGHKLKKSSFPDKLTALTAEIGPGIFWFLKGNFFMAIDDKDLLPSSIAAAPTKTTDWLKRFTIGIPTLTPSPSSGSPTTSSAIMASLIPSFGRPPHKPYSMIKWLTNVMETLFMNTDGTGLFVKNPGSTRLHPNLATRRKARWSTKDMEFAGALVGKYICDSINYGLCIDLTYLRFTKSFLACLIGVPVTYEQFQSDYPTFYEKRIKPVLNDESDELSLKFETPKGFESEGKNPSAEKIALIPDGNNIKVTQRNKIHYLNLLALHILKSRHEVEINAFRSGFYDVLPQGLVADFDIDELERLICGGGGASFKVDDLKKHHRVIGDLLDHAGLSDTDLPRYNFSEDDHAKILRWFWIVLTNLSQPERTTLLKLVTGSNALPTCGFKDLSPKFTISLTGGCNERPKFHPLTHVMAVGKHTSFARFEKNIIESLYDPEDLGILDEDLNGNGGSTQQGSDSNFLRETETPMEVEPGFCTIT